MKNNYIIIFLLIGINFIVVSCYYPKVKITPEEYNSIVYKKKQKLIFINNDKIQDTVLVYLNYPRGYKPNFDFWWNKKINKNDTISSKRNFGKQFTTSTNYENNKYKKANLNLYLFIHYSKDENDNGLILKMDKFKEKYNLNNFSVKDTLIFKESENLKICMDENCIKKIKYIKSTGIVYVEKGNGEIWQLK